LLASHLNKPFIELREYTDEYSEEIGFTRDDQKEVHEKSGFDGFFDYMQTFFAHANQRIVEEHKGSIIALDPLQSVVNDNERLRSTVEHLTNR